MPLIVIKAMVAFSKLGFNIALIEAITKSKGIKKCNILRFENRKNIFNCAKSKYKIGTYNDKDWNDKIV